MCYGDQVANVPNKLKKDVVPRKTRSQTIVEETDVDTDSDTTLYSSSSDKSKESANETADDDEPDMDLFDDNLNGDNDDGMYGVFMHNKSIVTPNSTYLSLTVTSFSLDFIQTLLDEIPSNELTDFMSYLVYTDAQTTSVNKKKKRKDVGKPSSRSSRRDRSSVVIVQDDTLAMQPLDQAYILIQKHSKPEWLPKKLGLAKKRTTWFDLFLKSDIDKDENHIFGPSNVSIVKKFKELIQKDELTIVELKTQD
uniref:Uncharacterized protein n=1 Tax=Tanacetum cinerariifolium TaxID=118510 RepID=A0A6L2MR31_TANCI|nr:hypothetical protein [Tanacetum cinerariifolium]